MNRSRPRNPDTLKDAASISVCGR